MRPHVNNGSHEVEILARGLANGNGRLSPAMAHHILGLGFDQNDKERMHELAARNQDDKLSPAEKEELLAYAKAGSLLSLWKSQARRVLRDRTKKPTPS